MSMVLLLEGQAVPAGLLCLGRQLEACMLGHQRPRCPDHPRSASTSTEVPEGRPEGSWQGWQQK